MADDAARIAQLEAENAALRDEVGGLRAALGSTLERETATTDVLRVIASVPVDVQRVLDQIVEHALRLGEATSATIRLVEDGKLNARARAGLLPGGQRDSLPLDRGYVLPRAVLDRRMIHLADAYEAVEAADYEPTRSRIQAVWGHGSALAIPLMRDGDAIGVLGLNRSEVRPFADRQIELLQTFADQAVIAIENARLFDELERRTRDLAEALEHQTATSRHPPGHRRMPTDLQPVLDAIAERAVRLCDADDAIIQRLDGDQLVNVAGTGPRHLQALNYTRPGAHRPGHDVRSRDAGPTDDPRRGCGCGCGRVPRFAGQSAAAWLPHGPLDPAAAGGRAARRARSLPLRHQTRSPSDRSPCWRRSPTRRSSPSRTPGCSRSWSGATPSFRRATAKSPRRWSSRRPRPRCCGSSRRPPRAWTGPEHARAERHAPDGCRRGGHSPDRGLDTTGGRHHQGASGGQRHPRRAV